MTQLRDSLPAISSAVRESLRRRPRIVLTLGGLGPTHDDMTLAGIALALNKPLMLNRDALRLVEQHYQRLESKPRLTKYRTKMATLPRGAESLPNPVGTAPGVMLKESATTIFSLPGVPSEMRAIFQSSIVPFLKRFKAVPPNEIQFAITGIIESALAPVLDEVRKKYPGLYFKSHPRGKETGVRPLIILQIYNTRPKAAGEVDEAASQIITRVSNLVRKSRSRTGR